MTLSLDQQLVALVQAGLTWLLRTRMSFYQYDLQLPWWFGLCCWNYAIAGLTTLWLEPRQDDLKQVPTFPFQAFGVVLVLVQAPLSYAADYLHMHHDSYWHVLDRLLAVPLTLLEISRIAVVLWQQYNLVSQTGTGNTSQRTQRLKQLWLIVHGCLYVGALSLALYCFRQSQAAQEQLDRQGFVVWHTGWHLYPIAASILALVDFYLWGGWRRSNRQYFYAVEWHYLIHRRRGPSKSGGKSHWQKQKLLDDGEEVHPVVQAWRALVEQ